MVKFSRWLPFEGLRPPAAQRDAVVAACAALGGGGGAREYRIHRSKFDADAPDELLASARVDSYGVVEAVVEDLRARRISCYARRVVEQKDALEAERAHVVRDQCDEARRAAYVLEQMWPDADVSSVFEEYGEELY